MVCFLQLESEKEVRTEETQETPPAEVAQPEVAPAEADTSSDSPATQSHITSHLPHSPLPPHTSQEGEGEREGEDGQEKRKEGEEGEERGEREQERDKGVGGESTGHSQED